MSRSGTKANLNSHPFPDPNSDPELRYYTPSSINRKTHLSKKDTAQEYKAFKDLSKREQGPACSRQNIEGHDNKNIPHFFHVRAKTPKESIPQRSHIEKHLDNYSSQKATHQYSHAVCKYSNKNIHKETYIWNPTTLEIITEEF
jgi:hypothetical protein